MATLPDASVDSIVTDPPYELGFMGKGWDRSGVANDVETWRQALRVLKPGGHLLAFSGTRTYHRMVCAIEDAGFEVRDQIGWLYGSGFPKSLDVSKAIDKARDDTAEVECVRRYLEESRERVGLTRRQIAEAFGVDSRMVQKWMGAKADPQAHCPTWEQWLNLKVLLSLPDDMDAEVWRLNGRKGTPGEAWEQREVIGQVRYGRDDAPRSEKYRQAPRGTADVTAPATDAARQWAGWGTALKPAWEPVCVARKPLAGTVAANVLQHGTGALNIDACRIATDESTARVTNAAIRGGNLVSGRTEHGPVGGGHALGRWPANVIHDGSDEVLAAFPVTTTGSLKPYTAKSVGYEGGWGAGRDVNHAGDTGSAARFFYTAKASGDDRNEGLGRDRNTHPTVKPTELMRYLCRLVTPPGGTVLDPFMGSGSTLKAAELEGFSAIGIELQAEYIEIAKRRIAADAPLFADVEAA